MRFVAFVTAALCLLAGCGYVGPIVPPSAQIPIAVHDLSVSERGDQLVFQFTAPANTTDGLGIHEYSNVDLRVGVLSTNAGDLGAWANSAQAISVEAPDAIGKDEEPRPIPIESSAPAAPFVGKRVAVAVRLSVRKEDHFSDWSNLVTLDVLAPLKPPQATIEATAAGYKLTWTDPEPGVEYHISRQSPGDKQPVDLGSTKESSFTDSSAHWETPYTYTVTATEKNAESLPWTSGVQNAKDIFPPSVPTDLTAFATADSIELAWRRSPESDLAGYFVWRATGGGQFEKLTAVISVPSYTDRKVEHGKAYRYAVSAIDQKTNESEKSQPVSATFP